MGAGDDGWQAGQGVIGKARLGRCINHRHCGLADAGGAIPIAADDAFLCPECRRDLIPFGPPDRKTVAGETRPKPPLKLMLLGLLVVALVGGGIIFDLFRLKLAPAGVPASSFEVEGITRPELRIGADVATRDGLAPGLARGLLSAGGCKTIEQTAAADRPTIVRCTGDEAGRAVAIVAPPAFATLAAPALGTVDATLTTRGIDSDAIRKLPQLAVLSAPANEHAIGIDAVAVIVHPSNPLARLSTAQLASILSGATANYAAAGGRAGPIRLVLPANDSPEADTLRATLPGTISGTATRLATSAAIAAVVGKDPTALGIVAASKQLGNHAVAIGPADGVATPPTSLGIASADYPLARPLLLYRSPRGTGPQVSALVDYARSPAGQATVGSAGFEPVEIRKFAAAAPAGAPADYAAMVAGAQRLSADLRFKPGSLDFTNRTVDDLDRIAAMLVRTRITADRLILIGFDDSARTAGMTIDGSLTLARRVATSLAARGLPLATAHGVGGAMPVADMATPAGRNHNRRVEVWVRP